MTKLTLNRRNGKTVKVPYRKVMRVRNCLDLGDINIYRQTQDIEVRQEIYIRIMQRYSRLIAREIGAVKVSGYDFEDLMQESCLVLHEVLQTFKVELKSPFWPFLRMCIKRNLYSLITVSRNYKNYLLNNSSDFDILTNYKIPWIGSHENRVIERLTAKNIIQEMKLVLSQLEYRVFIERNFNMLTYKEISIKYGFGPKQIDNAVARVTKKIRQIVLRMDMNQGMAS